MAVNLTVDKLEINGARFQRLPSQPQHNYRLKLDVIAPHQNNQSLNAATTQILNTFGHCC